MGDCMPGRCGANLHVPKYPINGKEEHVHGTAANVAVKKRVITMMWDMVQQRMLQ